MAERVSAFWREHKRVLEPMAGVLVHDVMAEAWELLLSDKAIGIVEFKLNDVLMTMRRADSLLDRR